MSHTLARLAVPAALCAALWFASAAPAALGAPASSPGPSQSTAAKERAHGKKCAPKLTGGARSRDFAKCVQALSKLASGRSTSPKSACRLVSHKRKKGRKTSPFERCVTAGTKLVKKAQHGADSSDPGASGKPDDDALPGDGPDADLPGTDPLDPWDDDLPPVDPADALDGDAITPVEPGAA